MSKFTKLTSFVIAVVVTLGLMVPAFASAAALPSDVQGTKYEESVQLLQALSIMVGDKDTGNFRLEDSIKRSEVAKIAVLMAGLGDVAQSSSDKSSFPDVAQNHWAVGYINVAAAQKFVIGDDMGNFRPDDTITFAEAVTILDRVLGYEPSAQASGGFPTGYLVAAGSNGLLKGGITAAANSSAIRGTVAMMAFNALTIDLMERTGYGTDEQYEVGTKTLLTDKLDVTKEYGQLVANNQSTLNSSSNLQPEQVEIKVGNAVETYEAPGLDTRALLAKNVIFYVQEDTTTNDQNVILIRDDQNKNDELTVSSTNVDSLTTNSDGSATFKYWVNKDTDKNPTQATIASNATVFYNGVATDYDLSNILNLTSGNVRLLDTTSSDKYNYVFVTEYKNMVVDEVSPVSYRVSDKDNLLSLTLDPKDKNLKFTITKDGQPIQLTDLKEWDILSVAMDKATPSQSSVINVYVSDKTATGKVTEINSGKYTINGVDYELASNFTESNQPAIKLNDEGTFYLDVEGKIAAVDTQTRAGSSYAYLVNAKESTSIDPRLELQLFGKDGETATLTGADKIKVNDVSGLDSTAALAALKAANNGSIPQLITYETNSNGDVYYINTAKDNTALGTPIKDQFTLNYKSDATGIEFNANSQKLGNYNIDANTIILDIPTGKTDPADYAVRTSSMFVDKTKYDVEVYDLSEDLTAGIIIVKNSAGEVNSEASIAVVSKIAQTYNADQETVHKLYAYQNGQPIELLAKDLQTLVKPSGVLQAGDIIQYTTNARGEIDKVSLLFNSADRNNDQVNNFTQYPGTEMQTVVGTISKKFATSINVVAAGMPETNFNISNATIYNYDFRRTAGSQVSIVDASYLSKYDSADAQKVFIRIYKGQVKEVVIIQEQ